MNIALGRLRQDYHYELKNSSYKVKPCLARAIVNRMLIECFLGMHDEALGTIPGTMFLKRQRPVRRSLGKGVCHQA